MTIENRDDFLFTIKQKTNEPTASSPVTDIKNRVNLFQDDGTIAKDITTPEIAPTERNRKQYKPVDQLCQRCNKSFAVNPAHVRDFFVCDPCLKK
jgi:hypothetical protein